jgi:hypothetical protein
MTTFGIILFYHLTKIETTPIEGLLLIGTLHGDW